MKNKLFERKGDTSVFQILFCIGIITFMLFFPVITFSYFKLQNTCDAIGLDVIQAASTRGGVDDKVIELLVAELQDQGYDFDGNVIQQEDGNLASSVRVYTNANLISGGVYELENGKKIRVDALPDCSDGSTNIVCNNERRYRTDTNTKSKIKMTIIIPVSSHSSMINNLYTLITMSNHTSDVEKIEATNNPWNYQGAGYIVTNSTLSELYDDSTIVH